MARINKQEVLQEMQEGLRLDTAREKTPQELAEKVLPVYKVNPKGRFISIVDATLNDSNKSFTVPEGKTWKLLYGHISLITTATVGNRNMNIRFLDDAGNIMFNIKPNNNQAASLTEDYNLYTNRPIETLPGNHLISIPNVAILLENWVINVRDDQVIDVAADDMTVRLVALEEDMNPNK